MSVATDQRASADSLVANKIKNRFPIVVIFFPIALFRVLFYRPRSCPWWCFKTSWNDWRDHKKSSRSSRSHGLPGRWPSILHDRR